MRRFRVQPWLAAGLALCLVLCPPLLVVSLRQGRNVDPETVLVMLAGGLAIADRRPLALGVVIAVGATIRESSLFLIPFAYAYWAARPVDPTRSSGSRPRACPAWRSTWRSGRAYRLRPTATARRSTSSRRCSTTRGRAAPHLHRVRTALVRRALRAARPALRPRRASAARLLRAQLPVRARLGARAAARGARRSTSRPRTCSTRPPPAGDRRHRGVRGARRRLRRVHAGARRRGQHHQRPACRTTRCAESPGAPASGCAPSP